MKKKMIKNLASLMLRLLMAVAIAAIVLAAACIMMDGDMAEVMTAFFLGPVEDEYAIAEIMREMVPLIFTGVAVSLMVRCGQFNMFVEGAFFGGAFAAGVLAPMLGEHFLVTPLLAIVAAAVLMGLIGYVPAKMKSALGINEFVSSLMLNYIVYWLVMYLIHGVAGDPDYVNATRYLEDGMRLPFLNEDVELSSNLILALLAAVLGGLFLFKTKWGYALRMTGDNPTFTTYAGIPAKKYVTSSQVIGSALAGLGGAYLSMANLGYFSAGMVSGRGFIGIAAEAMGTGLPLRTTLFAFLFGAVDYFAVGAQTVLSFPYELLNTLPNLMTMLALTIYAVAHGKKKG